MAQQYIHGSSEEEQRRLALMNGLINDRCFQALGLGDDSLILDLGAGTGIFARKVAGQLPKGSRVIGVERDPRQYEVARMQSPAKGGAHLEFRLGDALNPPLQADERGRVDLAYARFLLEHVPDPQSVVSTMVAALAERGRLVLMDDDHDLMRISPSSANFDAAWRAYYLNYAHLGTDPIMGRRLVSLIHEAGAKPVWAEQLFYGACAGESTFAPIIDNLVGVMCGARDSVLAEGRISAGRYDAGIADLNGLKEKPDGVVWYVINVAEGRRM